MAFDLSGSVKILRIVELLTKTLSVGDLVNYYLAIDNVSDNQTYRVSLSEFAKFAGGSNEDSIFEIINSADNDKKFAFSAAQITTGTKLTLTIPDISGLVAIAGMVDPFAFGGQAHGGKLVESFSASKTFDCNNGNCQEMEVTATTTIGVTNEQTGTYLFWLIVNTASAPTINIGASFGDKLDNSADISNANGAVNIITLVVSPSGVKKYAINTKI